MADTRTLAAYQNATTVRRLCKSCFLSLIHVPLVLLPWRQEHLLPRARNNRRQRTALVGDLCHKQSQSYFSSTRSINPSAHLSTQNKGVAGGSSTTFARPIPLTIGNATNVVVDNLRIIQSPFWVCTKAADREQILLTLPGPAA